MRIIGLLDLVCNIHLSLDEGLLWIYAPLPFQHFIAFCQFAQNLRRNPSGLRVGVTLLSKRKWDISILETCIWNARFTYSESGLGKKNNFFEKTRDPVCRSVGPSVRNAFDKIDEKWTFTDSKWFRQCRIRRKEGRGGGMDEEEGWTRRKDERGERSDVEEGAMRRVKKWKMNKAVYTA